jgi:hypothetical protein
MFTATTIPGDHKDLIHDVAYDWYGRRLATCSSDQVTASSVYSLQFLQFTVLALTVIQLGHLQINVKYTNLSESDVAIENYDSFALLK